MKRPADPTFVHHLLGQRDRRHAAVVEPHHVRHARLLDGGDHFLAFLHVHRERLFAEDHFPGRRRREHDFAMRVVGRTDVDDVDVLALDQLSPVGLIRFVAPVFGERLDLVLFAAQHAFSTG